MLDKNTTYLPDPLTRLCARIARRLAEQNKTPSIAEVYEANAIDEAHTEPPGQSTGGKDV